jgi:hypothetical protein
VLKETRKETAASLLDWDKHSAQGDYSKSRPRQIQRSRRPERRRRQVFLTETNTALKETRKNMQVAAGRREKLHPGDGLLARVDAGGWRAWATVVAGVAFFISGDVSEVRSGLSLLSTASFGMSTF